MRNFFGFANSSSFFQKAVEKSVEIVNFWLGLKLPITPNYHP
jgi:hypothetical protein